MSMNDKQPSYFQKQFDNDTRDNKKWSNCANKYVSLQENEACDRMLKAFITAVENSNTGFKFDWNKEVSQLNGKFIGGLFGLEEYINQDGNLRTSTKVSTIQKYSIKLTTLKYQRFIQKIINMLNMKLIYHKKRSKMIHLKI